MKKLLFAFSILLLSGCGSTSNTVTSKPSKYNPNFDFTPPERSTPNSTKITIALINPFFISENPAMYLPPYSTFIGNMADDFEEILIAKGFSLRGPFTNRYEMVYGDKKNSDIALSISISLKEEGELQTHRSTKTNWGRVLNKGASDFVSYKVAGTFYHHGTLNIEATDPYTGEKFWKKTVSLPRKEIVCHGVESWNAKPSSSDLLSKDVGVYNPVSKALESYYADALSTVWRHIDSEELAMVKQEIEKAKN